MFTEAKPIFIKGKNFETNFQAGFVCKFNAEKGKKYSLKLAASTLCRVTLNGKFLHYGPARPPHGYLKVDEIAFTPKYGENILAFEVAGYNCPSFYTLDIPSFLQCEIIEDGEVKACTGRDFKGISLNSLREQRAARYSFQRAFSEIYYYDSEKANWQNGDFESEELEISDPCLSYIPRGFKLPEFNLVKPAKYVREGKYTLKNRALELCRFFVPCETVKTFSYNELPNDILSATDAEFVEEDIGNNISASEFRQFEFENIRTGFVKTKITVLSDAVIYVVFSEKLCGKDIPTSNGHCDTLDIIKYKLPKGEYELESFECYSLKYIALMVESGEVSDCMFTLREYTYPVKPFAVKTGDTILDKTVEACYQGFRQNTLDCFMDCPGRERGGWLCDSYFTGMASYMFTGDTESEKAFLDNFRLAKFPGLPDGLLPECYPGDNLWDSSIPQWTLWFVMEVYEFSKRGGDPLPFEELIDRILNFFKSYENSDGLLEKLPYWNFVEWTKANNWVQDVNYPTNMLYAGVLRAIARLYDRPELYKKADSICDTIVEQSFDGEFFRDHAKRNADGTLEVLPDRSAICQHEAVMFEVININVPKFATLKKAIYDSFGATGNKSITPSDIEPLDLFIGFAVRVEVLMKLGLYEKNLEEMKEVYGAMANATGTLWEHRNGGASRNHGFGSFVAVRIVDCLKALRGIE